MVPEKALMTALGMVLWGCSVLLWSPDRLSSACCSPNCPEVVEWEPAVTWALTSGPLLMWLAVDDLQFPRYKTQRQDVNTEALA